MKAITALIVHTRIRMKKNLTNFHIIKQVINIDRSKPHGVDSMYYEYCNMFSGTESQASRYCTRLDKEDPDNKKISKLVHYELPPVFSRVEFSFVEDTSGWVEFITDNGSFELRGYNNTATIKLLNSQWLGVVTCLSDRCHAHPDIDQIIYEIINGTGIEPKNFDVSADVAYKRAKERQELRQKQTQETLNKLDLSKLESID